MMISEGGSRCHTARLVRKCLEEDLAACVQSSRGHAMVPQWPLNPSTP